ncbi:MAG: hypothetical protein ACE5FW_01925, partial [Candidatus Aenigmatarchaeota archaeon]
KSWDQQDLKSELPQAGLLEALTHLLAHKERVYQGKYQLEPKSCSAGMFLKILLYISFYPSQKLGRVSYKVVSCFALVYLPDHSITE